MFIAVRTKNYLIYSVKISLEKYKSKERIFEFQQQS